eukprot:1346731-Rhodomonas_salina.2
MHHTLAQYRTTMRCLNTACRHTLAQYRLCRIASWAILYLSTAAARSVPHTTPVPQYWHRTLAQYRTTPCARPYAIAVPPGWLACTELPYAASHTCTGL